MNTYRAKLICSLFGALLFGETVMASVVDSTPRTLKQPDGAIFSAIKHGDEYLSWVARPDGRPIAQGKDGTWFYISNYVDGRAQLSKFPAHGSPPTGKAPVPRLNSGDLKVLGFVQEGGAGGQFDESQMVRGQHEGKVLILVVEFTDRAATYDTSVWASRISGEPGDSRSVIDYFDAASYGKVTLSPAEEWSGMPHDGVIGPISLQREHPDLGADGAGGIADPVLYDIYHEAITEADNFIDFRIFDTDNDGFVHSSELSIVLVYAGFEAAYSSDSPSMFAHARTSGVLFHTTDIGPSGAGPHGEIVLDGAHAIIGEIANDGPRPNPLGVLVHELGHLTFGLPDLYDHDGDIGGDSGGIGAFGVMASGSHGQDPTRDLFPGETPTLPSAWTQYKLDWVDATANLNSGSLSSSSQSGLLLNDMQVGIAHPAKGNIFTGNYTCPTDQYFLIQYRTPDGYDRGLSALNTFSSLSEHDGVVIYHVDERQSNNDTASAKLLDVEEANSPYLSSDLQGQAGSRHLWGLGLKTRFGAFSTPNSNAANSPLNSGVSIEIGDRNPSKGKNRLYGSIDVSIDSLCDP